jgi:hypothetical protein
MSDGASLLAPNPGPVLQLDPAQPDPLASYSPAQQQPPVSVGDQPATNVTTPPPNPMQTIDTPSTGMVPGVDPEAYVGAVHQRQVAGFLSKALSVLAGDTVHHVVTNPDGSIAVHLDEATNKEKWGRIAAAVLGGAAKGMGVGQGPGGGGRAVAAGEQFGQQIPQQQADSANKEAEAQQQIRLRNANNALLNQKIVQGAFNNSHLNRDDLQGQQDYALKHEKDLSDSGFIPVAMHVKDGKTLAQYGAANPAMVGAHMGVGGDMIYNEPDGEGGVNFYHLPANTANQPTTEATPVEIIKADPDDPTKPVRTTINIPAGTKKGALATQLMAINTSNDNALKAIAATKNAQQETNIKDREATLREQAAPSENAERRAQAGAASAEANLHTRQANLLPSGTPGTNNNPTGATGEAYLQSSGIDPASFNLIRSTANGDIKMPTMNRSPQNVAFRQAVMNYDPTFTDARYQVKQDFKNQKQADNLQALSTGLEHVERASINSAKLGNSPSLLTGRNLSGEASAYNQDVNLFTQEAGKLVKGGVIGQQEYEELKKGMTSPVLGIRDAALKETVNLLGGRVRATMQRYKTAAQQDLPVQEFFDQPTQDRLKRYGIAEAGGPAPAPAPGGGGPPSPHVFSKAAWLKANPGGDVNAAAAAATQQKYQVVD